MKPKILLLFFLLISCGGQVPQIYLYYDYENRRHEYPIRIEDLSLSRENPTEYYYCLHHEKLEEISLVYPNHTEYSDSLVTDPL